MVKWLVGLLITIVVLLSSVYVLIPGELGISKLISVNVPSPGVSRHLSDADNWAKWWPDSNNTFVEHNTYQLNNFTFRVENAWFNQGLGVLIRQRASSINSTINILPRNIDSVSLLWKCRIETSSSPFERIRRYQHAKEIKQTMSEIFDSLQIFLSKKENVYNLSIEGRQVVDTLLASTRTMLTKYPSTEDVYSLITPLRNYISNQGIKETNHPMLNVSRVDSNKFNMVVAIPTDKPINETGSFEIKRMIPGKILVAEVRGGNGSIEKAFTNFNNYVSDYQFTSAAIPFELLVTDRIKEPDSSKWITKLCYPVY
jgi:hypothetical protein